MKAYLSFHSLETILKIIYIHGVFCNSLSLSLSKLFTTHLNVENPYRATLSSP
ncbi:hypothetical protein HanPSC8_Chr09g0399871 [Helianthus annuus]|nr:hypothetical protein HanPSC8_Chr09g0399871 [Helianthus annuus]